MPHGASCRPGKGLVRPGRCTRMRLALLALAMMALSGCLRQDDGNVASVRLELENQGLTSVSGWLRAEDADGGILMHAQVMAAAGETVGQDQDVVVEDLEQFRVLLSRTGDDESNLARGADGDCHLADRIVFRVVVGPGPGADMHLTCE